MNRSLLYKSTSVKSAKAKSWGSAVGQYTALCSPCKQLHKKSALSENLIWNPYLHTISKCSPCFHRIPKNRTAHTLRFLYISSNRITKHHWHINFPGHKEILFKKELLYSQTKINSIAVKKSQKISPNQKSHNPAPRSHFHRYLPGTTQHMFLSCFHFLLTDSSAGSHYRSLLLVGWFVCCHSLQGAWEVFSFLQELLPSLETMLRADERIVEGLS